MVMTLDHNRQKRVIKVKLDYVLPLNYDLNVLDPIERQVIEMRWGLGEYKKRHGQREITERINATNRSSVGDIEKRAVQKLRENRS